MRSPRTDDIVAGISQRREPYQDERRRSPWRASTAAAVGIAAIAAWAMLYYAAQANYVLLETAYQAHLDTLNNPPTLQDPPAPVASVHSGLIVVAVLSVLYYAGLITAWVTVAIRTFQGSVVHGTLLAPPRSA